MENLSRSCICLPGKHSFNKDHVMGTLVLERKLEGVRLRKRLSPCVIGCMDGCMDGVNERASERASDCLSE